MAESICAGGWGGWEESGVEILDFANQAVQAINGKMEMTGR